jgi:hypothetical protein
MLSCICKLASYRRFTMVDEFSIAESIIVLKSGPFPSACAEDTKAGFFNLKSLLKLRSCKHFTLINMNVL